MVWCLIIQRLPRNSIRINTFYELKLFNHQLKLSAVRKVPETIMFQVLGSFETLGSKLSHGTSLKFADVRTHLRKVSNSIVSFNRFIYQDRTGWRVGWWAHLEQHPLWFLRGFPKFGWGRLEADPPACQGPSLRWQLEGFQQLSR